MTFDAARALALTWRRTMLPFCHVCAIAGSVRREKPEVRDLEIVAVPRWYRRSVPARSDAGEERINALYEAMTRHAAAGAIRWIKPATSAIQDWPLKPDGKYWRGLLPTGVKLDVFLASREKSAEPRLSGSVTGENMPASPAGRYGTFGTTAALLMCSFRPGGGRDAMIQSRRRNQHDARQQRRAPAGPARRPGFHHAHDYPTFGD